VRQEAWLIGNQRGMQALPIAAKTEMDKETKSAISCFLGWVCLLQTDN